jgi:hypothetical protein
MRTRNVVPGLENVPQCARRCAQRRAQRCANNGGWPRRVTQACFAVANSVSGVAVHLVLPDVAMLARSTPPALARARALLLLSGLAACTGAPATVAVQPDFQVMTPAGTVGVSMRQPLPGMTSEQFVQLVAAGMQRAQRDSPIAGRGEPTFSSQRIVWHDDPGDSRGFSRLIVNVFDGANPYAYEQATVSNDASPAVITSTVATMSARLMADIAGRVDMPDRLAGSVP